MKGEKTTVKHRLYSQIKEWLKEKNGKREQQQIQSPTPIGGDNKLGAQKFGQLY